MQEKHFIRRYKMKKLAVLFLSAAILLSAASCSGNDDVTTFPESKPVSTDTSAVTDAETEALTDALTEAVTDTVPDDITDTVTDVTTDTVTDDVTENASSFVRGKVTGNRYESEFIGIGLDLKDDWTILTDKEILAAAGLGGDMAGLDIEQMIKDGKAVYDFGAKLDDTTNIFISLEKSNALLVALVNLSDVYDNSAKALEDTYKTMGFTSFEHEKDTVKISGEDHLVMNFTASVNGVSMHQSMIMFKANDYIASAVLTTLDENLISSFYDSLYLLAE
jgi:cobalamin biosynthesis protein CobT